MSHPERMEWDDAHILLVEEGDGFTAYCSPEATCTVYLEEKAIGDVVGKYGAPFPFDIVFHEMMPQEGEVEQISRALGDAFRDQFDQKVHEVYDIIEEADDPLDGIMELTARDLNPPRGGD